MAKKRYSKRIILNLRGKDDYITEHYYVFKVILKDDKLYTVEEAKQEVKAALESEVR